MLRWFGNLVIAVGVLVVMAASALVGGVAVGMLLGPMAGGAVGLTWFLILAFGGLLTVTAGRRGR